MFTKQKITMAMAAAGILVLPLTAQAGTAITAGLTKQVPAQIIKIGALDLGAAKQQGLVGEKPDGLIAAVNGAGNADVQALVRDINAQRMDKYEALAKKHGVQVAVIQARAGSKLVGGTPAGQYFMTPGGQWQQK